MADLKELKGEVVQKRTIKVQTFAVDEKRVIVEGVLEDTRPIETYTITNEVREPGRLHGITARLLIGEMPARILDAEAEMNKVPMPGCTEAIGSVKKLKGMPIVYGFSKEVKDRLDGTEGCNHLTSLILAMGSAAVQGMAAHRGRRPAPPEARTALIEYIKNTCCVWAEEGDLYKKVSREIREEET